MAGSKKKTVAAAPHAVVKKATAVSKAAAAKASAKPRSKKAAAAGAAAAAAELEAVLGGAPSTSGGEGEGGPSRVVYIGHLPHGFYEDALKGYFSQFGAITRLRVSRNKKTAKARSYGFIEFASADVAQIAAEAMDGYLMFAQRLAVRVIPPSKLHPALFKGANRKFAAVPWRRVEAARANKARTATGEHKRVGRAAGRDRARAAAIKKAGIEYEYEPLKKAVGNGVAAVAGGAGAPKKRKAAEVAPAPAPEPAPKKAARKAAPAPAPAAAAAPAKKKAAMAVPAKAEAKPAARKAAAVAPAAARASKRVKK